MRNTFRSGKYIIILLVFCDYLDRRIWKISRHIQFRRVCAGHLPHPEYSPLGIAPWSLKRRVTGAKVPFHNSIIGDFMAYQDRHETNFLKIFVHPENKERFSVISVAIFEANNVSEQKQA